MSDTQKYHVQFSTEEVNSAGKDIIRTMSGHFDRGQTAQEAFFITVASYSIAMVVSMREAGMKEDEITSIMRQSMEIGISSKPIPMPSN